MQNCHSSRKSNGESEQYCVDAVALDRAAPHRRAGRGSEQLAGSEGDLCTKRQRAAINEIQISRAELPHEVAAADHPYVQDRPRDTLRLDKCVGALGEGWRQAGAKMGGQSVIRIIVVTRSYKRMQASAAAAPTIAPVLHGFLGMTGASTAPPTITAAIASIASKR